MDDIRFRIDKEILQEREANPSGYGNHRPWKYAAYLDKSLRDHSSGDDTPSQSEWLSHGISKLILLNFKIVSVPLPADRAETKESPELRSAIRYNGHQYLYPLPHSEGDRLTRPHKVQPVNTRSQGQFHLNLRLS